MQPVHHGLSIIEASPTGGGTGQTGDWAHAAQIARRWPIMLAGGLRPENVGEAIHTVRPAGVDVSSGVERRRGFFGWRRKSMASADLEELFVKEVETLMGQPRPRLVARGDHAQIELGLGLSPAEITWLQGLLRFALVAGRPVR